MFFSDHGAPKETKNRLCWDLTQHDPRDRGLICLVKINANSVFGFFRIGESNLGFSIFCKTEIIDPKMTQNVPFEL